MAPSRDIRVLVVEDESLVQVAVQTVIDRNSALSVVAVVDSVQAAMLVLGEQAVDVVLADLFLQDGTACQLAARMRQRPLAPPLVVTTDFASGAAAAACLDAGAALCIDKRALRDGMADALLLVAAGEDWSGPGRIDPQRGAALTYAEAQVLAHVASGLPDAAIADRLGYSQTYVKKILMTARARLGAKDRAHAAAMAATIGIVKPTGPGRFSPAIPRRSAHLFTRQGLIDVVDSEGEVYEGRAGSGLLSQRRIELRVDG
jgi:DNA-binding NarL/FixJ family response regulator